MTNTIPNEPDTDRINALIADAIAAQRAGAAACDVASLIVDAYELIRGSDRDRAAAKTRASHCSCGRPARQVIDSGTYGPTGYCGGPSLPLDRCDCGQGAESHDRGVCDAYGVGMASAYGLPCDSEPTTEPAPTAAPTTPGVVG